MWGLQRWIIILLLLVRFGSRSVFHVKFRYWMKPICQQSYHRGSSFLTLLPIRYWHIRKVTYKNSMDAQKCVKLNWLIWFDDKEVHEKLWYLELKLILNQNCSIHTFNKFSNANKTFGKRWQQFLKISDFFMFICIFLDAKVFWRRLEARYFEWDRPQQSELSVEKCVYHP